MGSTLKRKDRQLALNENLDMMLCTHLLSTISASACGTNQGVCCELHLLWRLGVCRLSHSTIQGSADCFLIVCICKGTAVCNACMLG